MLFRSLQEIAAKIHIPVLRKDFTVDEYMIYEARLLGASAAFATCFLQKRSVPLCYLFFDRFKIFFAYSAKRANPIVRKAEDPIVYVGKGSTRYHLSTRCHYLHNNLQAVGSGEVSGLRNAEGGRYSPCKRCVSGTPGGTVYVMPSGSSYHTSPDCTAIVAYVQAVRKSTVAYLGACSYCGRE